MDITDPRLSLSGLRASQWLHYGITYARVCLRDLLNPSIYNCYKTLIEACEVLLAYSLSEQDIQLLEERLLRHHQTFKEEYGEFQVKAKHHMALHIPQAIRDYGPVCNFWCFAYERLNGVMGQYVHSTTSPEVQIYKKFISDQAAAFEASQMATQLGSDTIETLPQQLKSLCQYQTGSTGNPSLMKMTLLSQLQCDDGNNLLQIQDALDRNEAPFDDWPCKLLHPRQRDVRLHSDMYDSLKGYFSEIYSDKLCLVQARMTRYARCEVNGVTFSSLFNRIAKGSAAVVYCVTGDEGHRTFLEPYYCSIKFFLEVTVIVCQDDKEVDRKLAYVGWYPHVKEDHSPDELTDLPLVKGQLSDEQPFVNVRRLAARWIPFQVDSHPRQTKLLVCRVFDNSYCYRDFID